ncbi:MAG: hypothetical protein ACKO0Z_21930 [Betaproteobacteria bacterium]
MVNASFKKGLLVAGVTAALFAANASAQDIQAQRLYAQSLAATCANCHGTNGVSKLYMIARGYSDLSTIEDRINKIRLENNIH